MAGSAYLRAVFSLDSSPIIKSCFVDEYQWSYHFLKIEWKTYESSLFIFFFKFCATEFTETTWSILIKLTDLNSNLNLVAICFCYGVTFVLIHCRFTDFQSVGLSSDFLELRNDLTIKDIEDCRRKIVDVTVVIQIFLTPKAPKLARA